MVEWLHKCLTASNVTFFLPKRSSLSKQDMQPYVTGFNHSRPDEPFAFSSKLKADKYRHQNLSGSDAAAHMSEEVKDAGMAVPRAMVTSFVVNGLMGLVILVSFLFCISNVSDAVNDLDFPGYPFLYILRSSMSDGAVTGITVLLLLLLLAAIINSDASASRQTFAFAGDRGLPFSRWISHVSQCL